MIFRQLFEPLSSTYTYLLGCEETGQAVLIDPVIVSLERDLDLVQQLGLKLAYSVDTQDRKSTRLNSSHIQKSRMPSSA